MKSWVLILVLATAVACSSPEERKEPALVTPAAAEQPADTTDTVSSQLPLPEPQTIQEWISLEQPRPEAEVSSPLTVTGQARGYWFYEGVFQVRLEDEAGNELARAPANAQGNWMQEGFVPYRAVLRFEAPATNQSAYLVLKRANPSALPENDMEWRQPVLLKAK